MPFKTLEFHNLLIFSKLWKQRQLAFSNFQRFPTFWQILEGFSHTDSHTKSMLHLHADPIRDTRFAGGRHPFVDCNRTVTHAVANYKKHEALKITFRVSRFSARTLGQRIRKRRLEMGLKQRFTLKREMNSTSRGSPVDELTRRSVTTGRALGGTTAPSGCQLPPVAVV